jgi:hypothetical protein
MKAAFACGPFVTRTDQCEILVTGIFLGCAAAPFVRTAPPLMMGREGVVVDSLLLDCTFKSKSINGRSHSSQRPLGGRTNRSDRARSVATFVLNVYGSIPVQRQRAGTLSQRSFRTAADPYWFRDNGRSPPFSTFISNEAPSPCWSGTTGRP